MSNGAKVIFRKADFEKDVVTLSAYSPGGSSLYTDLDLLPAASNAGQFTASYGLGSFDAISLSKYLTGKNANTQVAISGLYESVSGNASPKDFETMMQMIYLRFTAPRFDPQIHDVLIERNRITAKQSAGRPQTMMRDTIRMITSD